jgi:hypothetical protein
MYQGTKAFQSNMYSYRVIDTQKNEVYDNCCNCKVNTGT